MTVPAALSTRPKTRAPRIGTVDRALGMPNGGDSNYVYVRLGDNILTMIETYRLLTSTTRNRAITELILSGLGHTSQQISDIIDPDPDPRDERRPAAHLTDSTLFSEVTGEASRTLRTH